MLVERSPDPNHAWVRFRPRSWPGATDLWLDLSTRSLGRTGEPLTGSDQQDLLLPRNDVVYLPPLLASEAPKLGRWYETLTAAGTPVLLQSLPGQSLPTAEPRDVVLDLLGVAAGRNLERLQGPLAGRSAVWPLIGGYTDDPALWREALPLLAAAGVERVQGICPDLSPAERRRIVDSLGETGFDKLFHGEAPSERSFSVAVSHLGLEPFLARPLPESPPRLRSNRRLAADLAWIGELWLRLGKAEARGQAFYRASRWVDREPHDVAALAREGNLGVIDWLESADREVIDEVVASGESSLLSELRRQYLDGAPLAGRAGSGNPGE